MNINLSLYPSIPKKYNYKYLLLTNKYSHEYNRIYKKYKKLKNSNLNLKKIYYFLFIKEKNNIYDFYTSYHKYCESLDYLDKILRKSLTHPIDIYIFETEMNTKINLLKYKYNDKLKKYNNNVNIVNNYINITILINKLNLPLDILTYIIKFLYFY